MFFPPGSLQGPKVDTKKALLLLDLQNDFVASNGKLPVPNTASFLPRLPALINKFREQGQVVFVKTIFQQPCPIFSPYSGGYNVMLKNLAEYLRRHPRRAESTTTDPAQYDDEVATQLELPTEADIEAFLNDTLAPAAQRCCTPSTKGAELSSQLVTCIDKQRDMVVTKTDYSLFIDPLVVMQFRARLISDLYICGSLSNIGVYATVLDAVQQGFNVILVEDCLGYRDELCHVEAMRQMADEFGASGIDYSELMDDLHGLLGDVVPASRYTRTFQLSVQEQGTPPVSSSQRVSQWMDTIDSEPEEPETSLESAKGSQPAPDPAIPVSEGTASPLDDSSEKPSKSRVSPAPSPPRKRSTSDRDGIEECHAARTRRATETPVPASPTESTSRPSLKKTRRESNTSKNSKASTNGTARCPPNNPGLVGHSQSTGHLETSKNTSRSPQSVGRTMSQPEPLRANKPPPNASNSKRQKQSYDPTYLGPDDSIGESDSKIFHNILALHEADRAFYDLKKNTAWQKMYHRTGEVPRLVAVQGVQSSDGTIPIYRHPADESPPLLPFDQTVDWLRKQCEVLVKHSLNHALVQFYRDGEDNISEHSDKTLDIVRGSSIVNLSLGAMRTMTLRTKKGSVQGGAENAQPSKAGSGNVRSRTTHRVRLPHNSLFVLGERTNANWLHSIKADKRLDFEKSHEELAFDGERISLTFRNIGTFIDPHKRVIWGQGATGKYYANAQRILQGRRAEEVGEQMIIGFGRENHLSDSEFDWQKVYGMGFDVVNFEIKSDGD